MRKEIVIALTIFLALITASNFENITGDFSLITGFQALGGEYTEFLPEATISEMPVSFRPKKLDPMCEQPNQENVRPIIDVNVARHNNGINRGLKIILNNYDPLTMGEVIVSVTFYSKLRSSASIAVLPIAVLSTFTKNNIILSSEFSSPDFVDDNPDYHSYYEYKLFGYFIDYLVVEVFTPSGGLIGAKNFRTQTADLSFENEDFPQLFNSFVSSLINERHELKTDDSNYSSRLKKYVNRLKFFFEFYSGILSECKTIYLITELLKSPSEHMNIVGMDFLSVFLAEEASIFEELNSPRIEDRPIQFNNIKYAIESEAYKLDQLMNDQTIVIPDQFRREYERILDHRSGELNKLSHDFIGINSLSSDEIINILESKSCEDDPWWLSLYFEITSGIFYNQRISILMDTSGESHNTYREMSQFFLDTADMDSVVNKNFFDSQIIVDKVIELLQNSMTQKDALNLIARGGDKVVQVFIDFLFEPNGGINLFYGEILDTLVASKNLNIIIPAYERAFHQNSDEKIELFQTAIQDIVSYCDINKVNVALNKVMESDYTSKEIIISIILDGLNECISDLRETEINGETEVIDNLADIFYQHPQMNMNIANLFGKINTPSTLEFLEAFSQDSALTNTEKLIIDQILKKSKTEQPSNRIEKLITAQFLENNQQNCDMSAPLNREMQTRINNYLSEHRRNMVVYNSNPSTELYNQLA
ncbi:hypothetical protein COV16_06280, partial [Candidatus Woesearchaeota archaeon CG10_big_fil_rev_8_21_14_0_10_34_8]